MLHSREATGGHFDQHGCLNTCGPLSGGAVQIKKPGNNESKNVLWYSELGMHDVEIGGGKNASLGEMIRNLAASGVKVPDGYATTAAAYREFLAHEGLADRINKLLDALAVEDVAALAK